MTAGSEEPAPPAETVRPEPVEEPVLSSSKERTEAPQGIFEAAADAEATAQAVAAAAPVVAERADVAQLQALDPDHREAVYRLLSALADNKYLLGRRYAEWCTGAPMLESAVAAAAMAQDELGHARSFYPLLRAFPMDRGTAAMEERGWQARPTSAMACLERSFRAWSEYVAANVLVDTALTTLLRAAVDSSYEPLRQRARKIVQEESTHWVHGSGWLRRLAHEPSMPTALSDFWNHAMTWFGPPDDPVITALVSARVVSADPESLRGALCERVEPLLREAGLAQAVLDSPLPWDRWDPAGRRLRAA